MKKLSFLLPLIIYLAQSFCLINTAHAQTNQTYKRVITEDTPFYANLIEKTPLFYLPYTYYVKILEDVGDFSHVEIHSDNGQIAIDGYVPTDMLFVDDQQVLYPYLNFKVKTLNTTLLYSDANLSSPCQYLFSERELTYYGEFTSEQGKVFYVSYNNRLGYIKATDVYPFTIENHPNELTFLPKEEETVMTSSSSTQNFFSIKFIIIACLLFAGLFALFVAVNNKNKKQNYNYYEENDYE